MREFRGLSDFFRNATDEDKREVYLEVIQKAAEEQLRTIEKVKERFMSEAEKMEIFELCNSESGLNFTKADFGGLYKDSKTLELFFMFSKGYFVGKVHGLRNE